MKLAFGLERRAEQIDCRLAYIRLSHQGLANQHGLNVGKMDFLDVCGRKNTAFRNYRHIGWNLFPQLNHVIQIDCKRMQVAIVYAHEFGSGRKHSP